MALALSTSCCAGRESAHTEREVIALAQVLVAATVLLVVYELFSRLRLTRAVIREVALVFVLTELWALRLVRWIYRPRFVVTGSCQMRGTCCTMIVGDPPRFIKENQTLLGLFAAYHRVVHDFRVVNRGPEGELIFSCGYLRDDGRCGIYRHRPFICRNYPVLYWFNAPRPLPGCAYGVAPRVVAEMKARDSLRIMNPIVAVHHPSRVGGREREELPEDFVRVDVS